MMIIDYKRKKPLIVFQFILLDNTTIIISKQKQVVMKVVQDYPNNYTKRLFLFKFAKLIMSNKVL